MKKLRNVSLDSMLDRFSAIEQDQLTATVGGCNDLLSHGHWSGSTWYRDTDCDGTCYGSSSSDYYGSCGSDYYGSCGSDYYGSCGSGTTDYYSGSGTQQFYDASGYPVNGSVGDGEQLYDENGNPVNYPGKGIMDCGIQSIAAITGLSLETVHRYATEQMMNRFNISEETAYALAGGGGVDEQDVDAILTRAGMGCNNISINPNYSTSFNNTIGWINGSMGHIVKVDSYDSATGTVHYSDVQQGKSGSAPLAAFRFFKSY